MPDPSDRPGARFGFLHARPVLALLMCLAGSTAGVLWHQVRTHEKALRAAAVHEAGRTVAVLREFRSLYSSEVVSKVAGRGIDIAHDYAGRDGTIPLPATLSMLLGERIADRTVSRGARLYSPYPFPWRERTGGLADEFAVAAWDRARRDPERPFFRFEESANGLTLRYAEADRMRASCVDCHNHHPQTPRRGWSVGDVRGLLEVEVAVTGRGDGGSLAQSLPLLGLLSALGLSCVWIVTSNLRANSALLETRVERRTAEVKEALTQLEAQKFALDQSAIVSVTDVRGTLTYVNDAFVEISGYSRDQLLGRNHRIVKSNEHPPSFFEDLWQTISKGKIWRGEIKNRHRDGSHYWVYATIVPFLDDSGKPYQHAAIRVDITARKNLEAKVAQAQKLESIGRLAAGIAHEINTPAQYVGDNTRFLEESFRELAPLLRKADELAEATRSGSVSSALADELKAAMEEADVEYLDEEIPRAIEQSLNGIDRVRKIVQSMKEFSHPGEDGMVSVDLNHAIENTILVASNEWKYVARMETDLDPDLPWVTCLPNEINQVVLNIIVNAAQAVADMAGEGDPDKGTIRISTSRDGDHVEVRIGDTGTGIPKEARDRVFDPFFTTKEVGRGSGQGLSIAHGVVVRTHGGSLDFETEIGQGTTFVIRLPIDRRPVETPVS